MFLHDGFNLYCISATYSKRLKPNNYYVVAKDKKTARNKWLRNFCWLNIISKIEPVPINKQKFICSNPNKYIVV